MSTARQVVFLLLVTHCITKCQGSQCGYCGLLQAVNPPLGWSALQVTPDQARQHGSCSSLPEVRRHKAGCSTSTLPRVTDASRSYVEGAAAVAVRGSEPASGTLLIRAVSRAGSPQSLGGDHFTAHLLGPAVVRGLVTDLQDGSYRIDYKVQEAGTYEVRVGLSLSDARCQERNGAPPPDDCTLYGSSKFDVISSHKVCALGAVLDRNHTAPFQLAVANPAPALSLPACEGYRGDGRWMRSSTAAALGLSIGDDSAMRLTRWFPSWSRDPWVWVPWTCVYRLRSREEAQACIASLGKPIVIAGDSVSGGYHKDFIENLGVDPAAVLHSRMVHMRDILPGQGHVLFGSVAQQLCATAADKGACVATKSWRDVHTVFLGAGFWDLRADDMGLIFDESIRDMVAVLDGWREHTSDLNVVFGTTPAVQPYDLSLCFEGENTRGEPCGAWTFPIPLEELNSHMRCVKYGQRMDRLERWNQVWGGLLAAWDTTIADWFAITDVGLSEWYDDSVHFYKGHGMSMMLSQMMLNNLCPGA